MKSIQAIRGMNDILPEETSKWRQVEMLLKLIVNQYGYDEIRTPVLEQAALFKRAVGDVTDIVEKEMYCFEDRNGDQLALRPEGTASCVRAALQAGLLHNQAPRLWYLGPMYRHERPQKGRYRQFYQMGVEFFGIPTPDADVEIIQMTHRKWLHLQISDSLTLQINSLGTSEERQAYRALLVEYFSQHEDQLDSDSKRRLNTNPLRILDSKNPDMKTLIEGAPKLLDSLGEASKAHFDYVCNMLDASDIPYEINPCLVRGLDYYSHTVFEWVTDELGAQGTVCAGGRYDDLVSLLGGKPTPAVGYAIGIERIMLLREQLQVEENDLGRSDIVVLCCGENAKSRGLLLAEALRARNVYDKVELFTANGFKSLFKRADKSGAAVACVIGDDEIENNTVGIKFLTQDKPQVTVPVDKVIETIEQGLALDSEDTIH